MGTHTFTAAIVTLLGVASAQNASLPIVNLGYERHQAIDFNQTSGSYNFSNIRYAQAPVDDLRFRAPVPAWTAPNSSTINNGSVGNICPQANPSWELISTPAVTAELMGKPFNETAAVQALQANQSALNALNAIDPRTNEDCLFLDVIVPEEIYSQADSGYGAPILVWIYGGGYVEGEKTGSGVFEPNGLFDIAQKATGQKFIYVAMNYRLGAFGWLSGPTLQSNGTANAGLYDQRTALEWVQKYIHLFGGDPNRVTVFGESAGGGSIMHQITAYNGQKGTPFAQAIPQSPGWVPDPSSYQQETTFQSFLTYANVSSLSELRNLSTQALQRANIAQVAASRPYGTFTYGPVVDGVFAPQLPGRALLDGSFDANLRIMAGHNSDEGLLFAEPNVTTNAALESLLPMLFTSIKQPVLDHVVNTLYPPTFNSSAVPYKTPIQRAALIISEAIFTCNTYYLDTAFKNRTHSYQFDVAPALHGQDVAYTFAPNASLAVPALVAQALQTYITTFAITGTPRNTNAAGVPVFPQYGSNATVVNLSRNISDIVDSNANPRCDFWQKALYY